MLLIAAAFIVSGVVREECMLRDSSWRRPLERVLRRDGDGRVITEIDSRGWEVQYTRDDAGRLVEKKWVNPYRRSEYLVRRFTYDVAGRIVEEADPIGHRKRIQYADSGTADMTNVEPGFMNEADQILRMGFPRKADLNPPDASKQESDEGRLRK